MVFQPCSSHVGEADQRLIGLKPTFTTQKQFLESMGIRYLPGAKKDVAAIDRVVNEMPAYKVLSAVSTNA